MWVLKKAGISGPQAVLGLGRYEHHIAGADRPHALFGLDRALAFHDEVKVLTNLVVVVRRRTVRSVVHHARQHIVDVGEFLIDEEGAYPSGHHRFESW